MTNFETMIIRETVCARRLLGATTETSVNFSYLFILFIQSSYMGP